MNRNPNFIQEANSIPEFSLPRNENPAATHLVSYLKKLKMQKIFLML